MNQNYVITIDGPAGSGKSTLARRLSACTGFHLLDTGAIYRVMALHLLRHGVDPHAGRVGREFISSLELRLEPNVASMELYMAGENVTSLIRTEQVGNAASRFSALPEIRMALLSIQREIGAKWSIVAEGRDMGTVVFPNASIKFFLVAGLTERSKRRYLELTERGETVDFQEVYQALRARDERDRTREQAPLLKAPDAQLIDTTGMTIEGALAAMLTSLEGVIEIGACG